MRTPSQPQCHSILIGERRNAFSSAALRYYTQNAPSKVDLVTDAFMTKWSGKYEKLMEDMVAKYGPLGEPKPQEEVSKSRGTVYGHRWIDGDRTAVHIHIRLSENFSATIANDRAFIPHRKEFEIVKNS